MAPIERDASHVYLVSRLCRTTREEEWLRKLSDTSPVSGEQLAEFLRGELGYDGNESVLSLEMVDISYIRPRSGDTKFEMKVFVSSERLREYG